MILNSSLYELPGPTPVRRRRRERIRAIVACLLVGAAIGCALWIVQ